MIKNEFYKNNNQTKMKYNLTNFLLLLIILAINFICVQNANKIKTQLSNKLSSNCIDFNRQNKNEFLNKVFEESKFAKNLNTTYFLFFSSKTLPNS